MTVKVVCPFCSKELDSPEELVGRQVACPRCANRFAISLHGNGNQSPASGVPTAKAFTPSRFAPSHDPPATSRHGSVQPVNQPPAQPPIQQPAHPTATRAENRPVRHAGPQTPQQTAPSSHAAPPPPVPNQPSTPSSTSSGRTVQVAKFVADGAVPSRLELGQDGQLPQLVANEGKESKEPVDDSQSGKSPWLLIGAVCFSVLMSVIMLWVPADSQQATSDEKAEARDKIKQYYIGSEAEIKPYQQLLRRAIQAHNRGDGEQETRLYKQVLQMLHSEEYKEKGLTAPKWITGSPNDRELEELLSVLLR